MKVPLSRPSFGDAERAAIARPLESGWVVQGPEVAAFERELAAFVGAANAIATTSCTTALQLAAETLGLEPGDEVVVPAFTWIATASAIERAGGRAVFCDVSLETWNLDPSSLERAVGPRTVGIVPVHLFGRLAPMDAVLELARARGLWVLEDAACALGATRAGRHAGTFGDAGCWSFHPRKSITTGEGGMLTVTRAGAEEAARSLRDHGVGAAAATRGGLPDHPRIGCNFRMTDLQAALGRAQLARAEGLLTRRRSLASRYRQALADVPWLRLPDDAPAGETHGWQAFVVRVEADRPRLDALDALTRRRDALMATLADAGVETRPGTHAPAFLSAYRDRGATPASLPGAALAQGLSLALPLYPDLGEDAQAYVCERVRTFAPV